MESENLWQGFQFPVYLGLYAGDIVEERGVQRSRHFLFLLVAHVGKDQSEFIWVFRMTSVLRLLLVGQFHCRYPFTKWV